MRLSNLFYTGLTIATFILLLSSCRKDDAEPFPQFDVITLNNVRVGDTASYNLTIESGHRELPTIIIPSKHGSYNSISTEASSKWHIFKYKPEAGFLGVDSVVFKSIEPVEKQTLYTHFIITVRE